MRLILFALTMVACGVMMAVQAPTNALLGRGVGSPLGAAFVSVMVSFACMAAAVLLTGLRPELGAARSLPWYAWTGGLYGAFYVLAMIVCAPRLGLAAAMTLMIAGQVTAAVVIDHFGLFGLPRQPVNPWRVLGAGMVIVGMLVARRK